MKSFFFLNKVAFIVTTFLFMEIWVEKGVESGHPKNNYGVTFKDFFLNEDLDNLI